MAKSLCQEVAGGKRSLDSNLIFVQGRGCPCVVLFFMGFFVVNFPPLVTASE